MMQKKAKNKKIFRQKSVTRWALLGAIFFLSFLASSVLLVVEKDAGVDGGVYPVGEPAPSSLFSPFDLTYVDEAATEALKRDAVRKVLPVYSVYSSPVESTREKLDQILAIIHDYRIRKAENPEMTPVDLNLPFEISEENRDFLITEADLESVRKESEMLFEAVADGYVLQEEQRADLVQKGIRGVLIRRPDGSEKQALIENVVSPEALKAKAVDFLRGLGTKNRKEREVVLEIFNRFLSANLVFEAAETKELRDKAIQPIEPIKVTIKKNELVMQRGMLVSAAQKIKIDQIQKAEVKHKVLDKFFSVAILIFLVYLIGFFYFYIFEKRTLLSFRMTLLINAIFLTSIFICKIVAVWGGATKAYLMPAAMAPVLLALLVNSRVAILMCGVMAVIIGPLTGFQADVMIAALLSSAAGVLASLNVRKRIHFLKVGFAIGIINFLVLFAFQLLQESTFQGYLYISAQGLANGLLVTTPIVFLLIPLFEGLFGLVTDITLLEVSDLNHPLLKRMVVEAPGTYHHSLVVATLAESACEAIGANALLARVGCYFHDIGKIARAEYFTENESAAAGRHEKLTPTMSCLIILNHVKDGIELGKRYKLREPILRFIPEHQGTGIIYYFYKKALDEAAPGQNVKPDSFRYPGPKPQSRETAVALLADSTEAASRSLKNPTPDALRQLVRKIINDKFVDGQLDECNLSLRDLHQIQERFVHNLMAIYHTRVTYPEKTESPDKPDLFRVDDFAKYRVKP